MKRIHIVGCSPRSGTTLMTECIASCFDIDLVSNHEEPIFVWPTRPGRIFLTKQPHDIKHIDKYLKHIKELYVIYMLRDPRDVIVSMHDRSPDNYWIELNVWKRWTKKATQLIDHPRFITVKYEDLVRYPDQIQSLLESRIPFLRRTNSFHNYHLISRPSPKAIEAMSGLRPIDDSSIGNWKRHLPRVAGQINIYGSINRQLIEFGYERDESWISILEGVNPYTKRGYWGKMTSGQKKEIKKHKGLNHDFLSRLAQLGHNNLFLTLALPFLKIGKPLARIWFKYIR